MVATKYVLTGSERSGQRITLSALNQPHRDELTFFDVEIVAQGVTARCEVESLYGDAGTVAGSEEVTSAGVSSKSLTRLSSFLSDLGSGPLWSDVRRWESLRAELTVALTTDELGHVDATFGVSHSVMKQTWAASCTLHYNLGDLVGEGSGLAAWFDAHCPPPT